MSATELAGVRDRTKTFLRFIAKYERPDDEAACWNWTACIGSSGYGHFAPAHAKIKQAHRVSYEFFKGPIPAGLQLDHLCRNRRCVNPFHLEPVTLQENIRRGRTGAWNREKTHCKHGHEFTPENTFRDRDGFRGCRTCSRATQKRYRDARKVAS